jgi:CheY-like chemotaxis protein
MSDDGFDLDFTKPPAPPAPQALATAREEATHGSPQLDRAGYYISKARVSAGKVVPRNGLRHGIFVIEDDRTLSKLVGEVLAAAGFLTRFARNREEINAEFNRPPLPDLVLLDIALPDADGFAILEKIRRHPKLAKVPVVMMTGRSDPADIARGLALGADGYVTKPFKVAGLVEAINTVLGKSA